jgi:acylphosphatase
MKSNKHVVISGKVQGVWFRANTKQKAEQLGIKGWVRNTSDGKVEAIFEGDEENISEMINWCRQGPPLAKVEDVKIEEKTPNDDYDTFIIRN